MEKYVPSPKMGPELHQLLPHVGALPPPFGAEVEHIRKHWYAAVNALHRANHGEPVQSVEHRPCRCAGSARCARVQTLCRGVP